MLKEQIMFLSKAKKKSAWVQTALERFERPLLQYALSILQDLDRARDTVTADSEVVERADDSASAWSPARNNDTPETLLLRDTLTPDLQAAIEALPGLFRQAVWLRDVEEFSYAEIAEMLSIPVGTVMSRISRGRRLLFDRLQHLRPVNA